MNLQKQPKNPPSSLGLGSVIRFQCIGKDAFNGVDDSQISCSTYDFKLVTLPRCIIITLRYWYERHYRTLIPYDGHYGYVSQGPEWESCQLELVLKNKYDLDALLNECYEYDPSEWDSIRDEFLFEFYTEPNDLNRTDQEAFSDAIFSFCFDFIYHIDSIFSNLANENQDAVMQRPAMMIKMHMLNWKDTWIPSMR